MKSKCLRIVLHKPFIIALIVISIAPLTRSSLPAKCIRKKFKDAESVVLACDAQHCDDYEDLKKPEREDQYLTVTSSSDGLRFDKSVEYFAKNGTAAGNNRVVLRLNRTKTYQTIFGFGGAFTDSTAMNYYSLSESTRSCAIKSLFSPKSGIGFVFGRVPMGATDFSTRSYTYDDQDEADLTLAHFNLTVDDLVYKIPMIKEALSVADQPLKLISSVWIAPMWMETHPYFLAIPFPFHQPRIRGHPGGPYYKAFAQYAVKFLDAYKAHNVTFWGISPQNEPYLSETLHFPFVAFDAETMRDFIALDYGPALESAGYTDVKLIAIDDVSAIAYNWGKIIFANEAAKNYTAGIALHPYDLNTGVPGAVLDFQREWPDKFILMTEYTSGNPTDETGRGLVIGSWRRAVVYSQKIFSALREWAVGWISWNFIVDMNGGPNLVFNFGGGPVVADNANDRFLKEPIYYAMGHFSKFLPPGSIVLDVQSESSTELEFIAAETPDKTTVAVLSNERNTTVEVVINDLKREATIVTQLPPFSIRTLLW